MNNHPSIQKCQFCANITSEQAMSLSYKIINQTYDQVLIQLAKKL